MPLSPTAWTKYVELCEQGISESAAQFRARYRIAKAYSGSTFDGIAGDTVAAYSELFRSSLTYSTVETYGRFRFGQHWRSEIELQDAEQAQLFRQSNFDRMHEMLRDNLKLEIRNKHQRFVSGESDDLILICASLRHMVLHGYATAHGVGLPKSPKAIETLRATSVRIMEHLDSDFSDYVSDLKLSLSVVEANTDAL